MDAGFAGFGDRDASRIAHVVTKEAGLARLDYFLASHFHSDHVGGLQALAKKIGSSLIGGRRAGWRTARG